MVATALLHWVRCCGAPLLHRCPLSSSLSCRALGTFLYLRCTSLASSSRFGHRRLQAGPVGIRWKHHPLPTRAFNVSAGIYFSVIQSAAAGINVPWASTREGW
ncbi:Uncharacterized protein HZ326_3945 [Fusarium oxysporum f. sp. albedinis]|nr:Uncharacterized protein HZ326_3945 [Fusarium oxysporum f. sp. albedinis]